ncbi:MAG TPA: phosphoenolpyruvate synthase [Candidatus Saccharimonadales bacterium]|nr:phosphoenolpyruvate synthase [Candidatus Saccharimonadales bacterium]
MIKNLVVWFKEVDKNDIPLVGGKGANLGEMIQAGFPVPNGFIVTTNAYYQFIKENKLEEKIRHLINGTNFDNTKSLNKTSTLIKKYMMQGNLSEKLVGEVFRAYMKLGGEAPLVAVRSSATAEDLPDASFAGQQETFLNVQGEANLLLKIKEAWASLFDARAIFYRNDKHINHFKVGIALPVQRMVESEKSGIMFSLDPVTNDKTKIVIEAIYGLGELIVQGSITPDHYEVHKDGFKILEKKVVEQKIMLEKVGAKNKEIKVSASKSKLQKITDEQIIFLAKIAAKLEKHYYFPQDMEWAIEKNKIYIVQTRPVTTTQHKTTTNLSTEMHIDSKIILKGDPASPGIASGPVRIIASAKEIGKVMQGDVLVASETNPDYVPAMKKAIAIITDRGGRTSHAAIVSREIGIPAIVGTEKGTKILKNGEIITINGNSGEIYKGSYQITDAKNEHISEHTKTATKVYVNLAEPDFAEKTAKRNIDGVGLLRAEFMMAGIGTHPRKMIHDGKKKEYVRALADGLASFCKVFSPRPVVYRASDFKTNEYRNLLGGKAYEPIEPNPMLGYRGAFRYIHNPEVFELELEAIKLVRNKLGLKNLWLMLPFVRNVEEVVEVKKILGSVGLHRTPTFKLWMMVEIPTNVILLDKFIEAGIDGVSIGSNDLTMLMLGTDRDNSEVAQEYNEQDPAMLWAYEKIIKTANKYKITSSMCGQAPSLYPNLLEKLVKWGITSVSVSPDAIDNTRHLLSEFEKKLIS